MRQDVITVSFAFLLSLQAVLAPWDSRAEVLEYLYVNANVGAAAGGHTAVKLGEDVFHYQFFPDERFLLVRESWSHFRLMYNDLLNRTIFSASISLSKEAVAKLRSTFTITLAIQKSDLFREHVLKNRLDLLNGLAAEDQSMRITGRGFFADAQGESAFGRDLREYINRARGDGFLGLQKNQAEQRIAVLIHVLNGNLKEPGEIVMIVDELSWLVKKQVVLDLLLNGSGLSSTALLGKRDMIRLDSRQREALSALLRDKMQMVAGLLGSPRTDSGEALLLEVARCHAIDRSIEEGSCSPLIRFRKTARPGKLTLPIKG